MRHARPRKSETRPLGSVWHNLTEKRSLTVASRINTLIPDEAITHAQVVAEVISVTRDSKEQAKLLKFLRPIQLLHANEADSQLALSHLANFHLSHALDFGDCLIAATALRLDFPVATLNDRHFRLFKGLKVIRPY